MIDDFYADLENLTKGHKKYELNIILEGFNVNIGKGGIPELLESLDRDHETKEAIHYQEKDIIITNTMFLTTPKKTLHQIKKTSY